MLHKIYHDYIFRVANLRDGLSTHMANVHLGLISANEHYELDPLSGILVRRIRSPQSLRPHLTVLVDDFYRAYTHGISTTDFSYDEGAPGRKFRCKVILLFWTGDYPAQALVSGTHSKTCHWCTLKSTAAPEITRRCWGDYRCYLPDSHPMRRDATYGRPETRPPPPSRTHEDFFTHGRAQEEYKGPEVRSPYKESGIKEASILAALPLFNIAWDILGDMMHIVDGLWKRHIFAMLAGKRGPAVPKPRISWTALENKNLQRDHDAVCAQLRAWTVSDATQDIMDKRSISLGGSTGWIRNNLEVFKHKAVLSSHDWFLLVQSAGDYLLHDVFPGDTDKRKEACLLGIKDACSLCISTTSAFDSENRQVIDKVKQTVIEALCVAESLFPKTEMAVMFHVLLHIPDGIYRWNNVRNFWSFFGERCMGWLIRFIHNRDLAVENIVTAYTRQSLVLGSLYVLLLTYYVDIIHIMLPSLTFYVDIIHIMLTLLTYYVDIVHIMLPLLTYSVVIVHI